MNEMVGKMMIFSEIPSRTTLCDAYYAFVGDPSQPQFWPLTGRELVGYLFVGMALALGASGGIGGGGIVVPVRGEPEFTPPCQIHRSKDAISYYVWPYGRGEKQFIRVFDKCATRYSVLHVIGVLGYQDIAFHDRRKHESCVDSSTISLDHWNSPSSHRVTKLKKISSPS